MKRPGLAFLIVLLSIFVVPLGGDAQQPGKVYRIGILNNRTPTFSPDSDESDRALLQGLQELGYVLGQNLAIEVRTVEREPDGPGALVASRVDVNSAGSTAAALAAKKATSTIPIVFCSVADPVGDGLVTNLARPGGNATGLSTSASELSGKRVELIREVVPQVNRLAVLIQPDWAQAKRALVATEAAARVLGVQILPVEAREAADFPGAFTEAARGRASALIVLPHPTFFRERTHLADLAAVQRLHGADSEEELSVGAEKFLEAGDPGTSQARADGLGAEPRGDHTTMTCAEGHMRFEGFSFGSIRIDGVSYDHDIVIDRGEVSKRRKKPSKRFRDDFGHTPLSTEEKIPWKCRRLIVGTGTGALPVMEEVKVEAKRRKVELLIVPTAQAIGILREKPAETNAILHVTC